jgi:hypothetical protein
MVTLKKVVSDDLYETIHSYIKSNNIKIEGYSCMVSSILTMIKDGYCFTMDRDILRDSMECLTFMYSPNDDMNKDRVIQQLFDEEDSDDESDDDDGNSDSETNSEFGGADLLKMMQMMSGSMAGGRRGLDGCEADNCEADNCEADNCEADNCEADNCEADNCDVGECVADECTQGVNDETLVPVK